MNELVNNPSESGSLQVMMQVSEMLAKSDLVPASYRNKPANVLLAAIAGQPFGFDPTMAMRSFNVIQGTPTLKPEIMLALVRQAGHSVTGSTTDSGATITGKRADTGDEMTVSFLEADARTAGLLGKGAWKTYPDAMYWARALSKLCRMLFPDVVLGAGYTAEELGGPVEADDRVQVSVAKSELVELCEGDVEKARGLWAQFGAPTAPLTPAQMDDLRELATGDIIEADVIEAEVIEVAEEGSDV